MQDPKLTPGKFDDLLESAECFSLKMSQVFAYAKANYVDPDGTFQDIRFVDFEKWLPIVRYIAGQAQEIGEECFGADMTPDTRNEILRIILSFLGIRSNSGATSFLSGIMKR